MPACKRGPKHKRHIFQLSHKPYFFIDLQRYIIRKKLPAIFNLWEAAFGPPVMDIPITVMISWIMILHDDYRTSFTVTVDNHNGNKNRIRRVAVFVSIKEIIDFKKHRKQTWIFENMWPVGPVSHHWRTNRHTISRHIAFKILVNRLLPDSAKPIIEPMLIISDVECHSPECNFAGNDQDLSPCSEFDKELRFIRPICSRSLCQMNCWISTPALIVK